MHQQTTLLFGLLLAGLPFLGSRTAATAQDSKLERLKYNHPGLVVDLGAGLWAWPLPMDVNGDGRIDLVIGIDDWTDYGEPWTGYNAYDNSGKWLRGPLRGQVYVARNLGTNQQPRYATPYRLTVVGGTPLETYG